MIPNAGVCPYARAFLEEMLGIEDLAAIVIAPTCDQMRRVADMIEEDGSVPAFVMNVPATWQTSSSYRLYVEELRRLGRFLASVGGKDPPAGRLAATMLEHDSARRSMLATDGRIPSTILAEGLMPPDATCEQGEGPRLIENKGPGVPLAFVGSHLLKEDMKLFDMIEEHGGVVALNASDCGERTLPLPFNRRSIHDDPLLELASAYFGAVPDAFRRPNSQLYIWLQKKLAESDIRGIVLHHYVWCDIWHAELARLRKWARVPVLDLSAGDESRNLQGRIHTQLESFIGMLRR